jgi:hypothetical protein
VMVTHDPYAANYADEIVSLLDGRRVEDFERGGKERALAPRLVDEDGDAVADRLRAR